MLNASQTSVHHSSLHAAPTHQVTDHHQLNGGQTRVLVSRRHIPCRWPQQWISMSACPSPSPKSPTKARSWRKGMGARHMAVQWCCVLQGELAHSPASLQLLSWCGETDVSDALLTVSCKPRYMPTHIHRAGLTVWHACLICRRSVQLCLLPGGRVHGLPLCRGSQRSSVCACIACSARRRDAAAHDTK